jgi:RHS repeat-associated protein
MLETFPDTTAREFDTETSLYYYRARYYDPSAGRFLNEDPLSINGDDLNFYRYVGNSPVSFYDPTGLQRTPRTGPPNSTGWFPNPNNPGEVTVRVYGPNGEAVTDYDYGQPHGGTDPHAHDWGRDKNGKPVRGDKRPIKPGEKVPPPTCPKSASPPQKAPAPMPSCPPGGNADCSVPALHPQPNLFFPWFPIPTGPLFSPSAFPILEPVLVPI